MVRVSDTHSCRRVHRQILFCVESTRGASSRVCQSREIVVNPDCDTAAGEFVCIVDQKCSVDRLCESDLELNTDIVIAGEAETVSEQEVRDPPVMTLLGPEFVNLKRGVVYRKCDWNNPDDQPTDDDPCDLGVVCAFFRDSHTPRAAQPNPCLPRSFCLLAFPCSSPLCPSPVSRVSFRVSSRIASPRACPCARTQSAMDHNEENELVDISDKVGQGSRPRLCLRGPRDPTPHHTQVPAGLDGAVHSFACRSPPARWRRA